MEAFDAVLVLAFAAGFGIAAWRLVRAPGGSDRPAATVLLTMLGAPIAGIGGILLAAEIARPSGPLPVGGGRWFSLGVCCAIALAAAACAWLPERVARWGWLAPPITFFAGWAWYPLMPLTLIAAGILLPRVVLLALARRAPAYAGIVAGIVLAPLVLFSALGLLLAIVFSGFSAPPAHVEWSARIEPIDDAPYEVTMPFPESDSAPTARLLATLREDAHVARGNATIRAAPDGRGLVVSGQGPVELAASRAYEPAGQDVRYTYAREGNTTWSYHGTAGVVVSWSLGPGCGASLEGRKAMGEQPPPPARVTTTPSVPTQRPCVHGD